MLARIVSHRHGLIVFISILLVVGFVATSLASYFVSVRSVRQSIITQELPLTSDTIYSEIQNDLLKPIFVSSMMANDTFLRDWVIDGESDIDKITKYLKTVQERYDAFTAFFVSEKTRTYYQSKGILKTIRSDEPRDAWYFRVRKMTEPYEINVDPDLANMDVLTIFINYRVYDYEGFFIGSVGVGLTVDAVRHLIDRYQETYKRTIYFLDGTGQVTLIGLNHRGPRRNLGDIPGLSALSARILSQGDGSFDYDRDGSTVLLNTRYIPELAWYLCVEQIEDAAIQDLRQTLVLNLMICLVIVTIVLSATWFTVRRYQERLEEMATTDKLTGLLNRRAFDILFTQAAKDAVRKSISVSAIIFDIDYFKRINDRHGHLAGDMVIREVAERIRGSLRSTDVVCRWGGEEFLALVSGCSRDDALKLAEKVRAALSDRLVIYQETDIAVSLSAGVASYRAGEDCDTLLNRADSALYRAKAFGRNRVEMEEDASPRSRFATEN